MGVRLDAGGYFRPSAGALCSSCPDGQEQRTPRPGPATSSDCHTSHSRSASHRSGRLRIGVDRFCARYAPVWVHVFYAKMLLVNSLGQLPGPTSTIVRPLLSVAATRCSMSGNLSGTDSAEENVPWWAHFLPRYRSRLGVASRSAHACSTTGDRPLPAHQLATNSAGLVIS